MNQSGGLDAREGNPGASAGKIGYLRRKNQRVMRIDVYDTEIDVLTLAAGDYYSLTDMVRAGLNKLRVADWLRTKQTLQMLFAWECRNNKNFNYGEFAAVMERMKGPGSKYFKLGVKDWIERTNATGLIVSEGRYGGTYGHRDIGLEFAGWVDPFLRQGLSNMIRQGGIDRIKSYKNTNV